MRGSLALLAVLIALGVLGPPVANGQDAAAKPQAVRAPAPKAATPSSSTGDAFLDATAHLDGRDGRPLALEQFRPRSMLVVPAHRLRRAKFPVVDAHLHPGIRYHSSPELLDEYVRIMDAQNIAVSVSLDGQMGDRLLDHRRFLWTKYRDRFVFLANIDWRGAGRENDPATWDCNRPDFGHRTALALAESKAQGASGLKIFKEFGLVYRNADGSLLKIDDPRWDPIWTACGRLGMPVLIHVADPTAFFLPIDANNERWEELKRHPDWSFYGPGFPKQAELLAAFEHVVARHPKTTFIGAHVASNAEDLAAVGRALDAHPNLVVDLAARIGELGRQPYTARAFLIKYADRVLFGTDGPRVAERLELHWRFLETKDEYFPYAEYPFPPQGFWQIYGVGLPDDVLKKIYSGNAARIVPGVRERLAKYQVRKHTK